MGGYRITSEGLSIWPLRRIYRSWGDLESIQLRPATKKNGLFGVGFYFKEHRSPVVFSGPPFDGVFKILDLALAYGPEDLKIAPEVLDFIERFRPKLEDPQKASLEEIVADANRRLDLKETWKARKLLKIASKQQADFPAYHIARAKLMLADGVGHRRILKHLNGAHQSFPEDLDLRMFYYWHALSRRNDAAANQATEFWQKERKPPALAALLADYRVNRGQYQGAADILGDAILNTEDPEAVRALNHKLEEVEKFQRSAVRRFGRIVLRPLTREWRLPRWVSLAFLIACFIGGIAFANWIKQEQEKQDRAREQREFERQEAIRLEPIRLLQKAEAGDVNAMAELWEAYKYGFKQGFSVDPQKQLYWMTRAAEAGHEESIRQLGFTYQRGKIVEKDLEKAFTWFYRGAEAGSGWCMWEVAHYYYFGIEPVEQDFEGSLYWYSRACKDDRGYPHLYVGWHYELGLGTKKDLEKAYALYRYASSKGKWWASERLSVLCYDPASPFYNPQEGWAWFLLALEQASENQIDWQSALNDKTIENDFPYGPLFNMGIWVTPPKSKIKKWFLIGVEHGDAYCAWKLSKLYLDGFFTDADPVKKGTHFLNQAINQGLPQAVWYGSILTSDQDTELFNPVSSKKLQQRAADLGFPPPGPYAPLQD